VGPDGLNIIVLMVDSLSRAQAMAVLPKLRALLAATALPEVAADIADFVCQTPLTANKPALDGALAKEW
jgi:hypothetical protein